MSGTSIGEIGLDLVVNKNDFEKSMSGIQKTAKKAALSLAAAFSVKKIVDFGKSCLELGSDLAEVQNVVDVTFPSMASKVDEFAKSAASSFGLSETMAKKFTGTFGAMAKAFGFSEKAAYDMGATLTGLAGDVASFYNITQDEAYTKLKSVFTGETESLKDLGVVMTQSALDAYALANGFGKTTQQMSEAEKVALRYQFVQNQLAAAQGDFARTSGSWANQVRILKLQFDSLKATIGQGLINLFTPIIKVVNTLIGKLGTLANAFKSFTELITGNKSSGSSGQISGMGAAAADASAGLQSASGAADNMASSANKAGNAAKKAANQMRALMGFDAINKLSEQTDDSDSDTGSGTGTSAGGLGSAVDFGSLAQGETVIDQVDSKFQKMFTNIKKLCEPATKSLKRLWNEGLAKLGNFAWTALKDFYHGFLVPVGKWTLGTGIPRFIDALNNGLNKVNWSNINGSLKKLWDALALYSVNVGEGLLWFWENVLVPLGTWTANEVVPRYLDTLSIYIGTLSKIIEALQPLFQWFWDNVLQPIAQWTGGIFLTVWDGINDALQKFSDWCAEHIPTIDELKNAFAGMHEWLSKNETALQMIAIAVGAFTTALGLNALASNAANIAMGLSSVAIGLYNGVTAIATAATTAFGAAVAFLTSPITIAVAAIAGLIAVGVLLYKNWDKIKEKCAQLRDWVVEKTVSLKEDAVEAFETLRENASEAMNVLMTSIKEKWDKIKEKFHSFDTWLSGIFKRDWTQSFGSFGNVMNGFLRSVSQIWGGIKKTFNGIITFISGVFTGNWKKAWQGVKETFRGVFSTLAGVLKAPLNSVIGLINSVIGKINSFLRMASDALSFDIGFDKPSWMGGGHVGYSYRADLGQIGTIPYLANGGFVEKNTPRLAMIGDNRHYGEIVSPEDKLQDMANKAAKMSGGTSPEIMQLLREILELLKGIDPVTIDEEALRKYFIKKTNQNTKATGKPELIT